MATAISELTPPVMTADDEKLTFECSWRILEDGSGGFEYTDNIWKAAGGVVYTHHGQSGSNTSDKIVMLRQAWGLYPLGNIILYNACMDVRGNWKGKANWGPWVWSGWLDIKPPNAPELEVELAQEDGCTIIEVRADMDGCADWNRDAYDMVIECEVRSNVPGIAGRWPTQEPLKASGTWGFDVDDKVYSLAESQWVEYEFSVRARGCAGDSPVVTARRVFCHPAVPEIKSVTYAGSQANGIVTIALDTRATMYRNVDGVELERLPDGPGDKGASSQASLSTEWETVDGKLVGPDGQGMTDNLNEAWPRNRGTRTWYRLHATHDGYDSYSVPVCLDIYQPDVTAKPGAAQIIAAESGDDGESIAVDAGWGDDTFTGAPSAEEIARFTGALRLTWADTEYAWQSTGGVEEFDCTWEDDRPSNASYKHTARVYVSDLDEGVTQYLRARRVLTDEDGNEVLGPWSGIVAAKPVSVPEWAALSAPAFVARGEGLQLTWTYGSESPQTGWSVTDSTGRVWAFGTDANGSTVIPASRLVGVSELSLYVSVTTGGGWVRSEKAVHVSIVDAPTCAVIALSKVATAPFALMVDAPAQCDVALSVKSRGIAYETPAGTERQYADDVVWTASARPGEVIVPDARLVNGCTYDVCAWVTDPVTGLSSGKVTTTFTVAWARLAGLPGAVIETDRDRLWATISPTAPDGADAADTCEIYRVTPDGAHRIAEGVAFGSTVTDRFAPYSAGGSGVRLAYRVCAVTPEGDRRWTDVPYELPGMTLRLDWGDGRHVELPYNIEMDDSIAKDFERRKHADGRVQGYWEEGAERDASFTTDMIRIESAEDRALVKEMGRYTGAVFVRTGGGHAFEANVELSKMKESYDKASVAVSLKCEEIDLTDEHCCQPTDIETQEVSA